MNKQQDIRNKAKYTALRTDRQEKKAPDPKIPAQQKKNWEWKKTIKPLLAQKKCTVMCLRKTVQGKIKYTSGMVTRAGIISTSIC